MRMGIIKVNDIRLRAHHGCMDEEARIGGDYIINVVLDADFSAACASDDLSDTVDYVVVHDIVRREMKQRSKLIEHAGARIADALLSELSGLREVRVEVVKLAPPIGGDVASVSIEVIRP